MCLIKSISVLAMHTIIRALDGFGTLRIIIRLLCLVRIFIICVSWCAAGVGLNEEA
jgi:hypothetical protein